MEWNEVAHHSFPKSFSQEGNLKKNAVTGKANGFDPNFQMELYCCMLFPGMEGLVQFIPSPTLLFQ